MKRLEWIFHIIAFAFQCGAIVSVFLRTGDSADLGEANPLSTISTAFILVLTFVLLLRYARTAFPYLPRMWPIMVLTLLAIVSMSWSDYPNITLHRSASLLTATLWGWYITVRYDLKDLIAIIRQATGLMAIASVAIAVAAPGIGGEDPLGLAGWRGVFGGKNSLGAIMAIGTVTYFYTLVAGRQIGIRPP